MSLPSVGVWLRAELRCRARETRSEMEGGAMPIDAYAAAVASGTWGRDGPHLECVWSAPLSLGGASSEPL